MRGGADVGGWKHVLIDVCVSLQLKEQPDARNNFLDSKPFARLARNSSACCMETLTTVAVFFLAGSQQLCMLH